MNRTFLIIIMVIGTASAKAQTQNTPSIFKQAWLEKWENSMNYTLAIANAMPANHYNFTYVEGKMTFAEQLVHIQGNMNWLQQEYFGTRPESIAHKDTDKESIITSLRTSFNQVLQTIKNHSEGDFETVVSFFTGDKTKLQILNLLQDHVTHHRGQLLVYLGLKEIEVPRYVGW